MIREDDLVVGACYFSVGYAEAALKTPTIHTYRFLGRDLVRDERVSGYYFRYFPTRWTDDEYEGLEGAEKWKAEYPDFFSGVGDPIPVVFPLSQVLTFFSLPGLIEELRAIEGRQTSR